MVFELPGRGHAGKDINDRYTHVLIEAHLAAAEQFATSDGALRDAAVTRPSGLLPWFRAGISVVRVL